MYGMNITTKKKIGISQGCVLVASPILGVHE